MFDQINGLPVHALVLHAAVIFVPLQAFGAIVYALVGPWRPKIGWAVALLAVVAPISTFVAKASGQALYDRLIAQGLKGPGKDILTNHMGYGGMTLWFSLALGVVTLVLVGLTVRSSSSLPKIVQIILGVIVIALAAGAGYFVFMTGDSGATAVWGTY